MNKWLWLLVPLAVIAGFYLRSLPGLWKIPGNDLGLPRDYFPTAPGTSWTYKIKLGEGDALFYRQTRWPQGENALVYDTYSRYLPRENKKEYILKLTVKAKAEKQGPINYPEGYEIKIDQDDLGIYRNTKQLFWAITEKGRFMVTEVQTFDSFSCPGSPGGPWGSWGSDGYALNICFFGDKPGIGIGVGNDSPDILCSEEIKDGKLHLQRKVNPDNTLPDSAKNDPDSLHSSHTTDYYFQKGVGLVFLEQKVDSKTTMTWALEK